MIKEFNALELLHTAARESSSSMAYDLLGGYLDATELLPSLGKLETGYSEEYMQGFKLNKSNNQNSGAGLSEILTVLKAIQEMGRD